MKSHSSVAKKKMLGVGAVVSGLIVIPIAYASQTHNSYNNNQYFYHSHEDEAPAAYENLHQSRMSSNKGPVKIEGSSAIPEKRDFILNEKINPCDDFHAYVCSNVEASFKLRDDRSSHTFSFNDSAERILEKKKQFFLNIDNEKKLSKRSLQMKQYYKACMNEAESANEERALVRDLKAQVDKIKTIEDYINLNIANMSKGSGDWSFIDFGTSANINNPKINDIFFVANFMFLPEHSYYDNKELVAAYIDLMTEFFTTVYPEVPRADLKTRAENVVAFEQKFKPNYPLPAEWRKRWTEVNYVKRADFFKHTEKFNFKDFFKKYVPEKTLIRDFTPESMKFAVEEVKSENLQILKDMYVYRNARGFMDDAFPELYKKRMEFSFKYLGGSPTRPERQERCTRTVMSSFTKELDQEMLPRMFPHFPKEKMLAVAEKVRDSILEGIQRNTWISEQGRKGAYEKIKSAKLQLIQPYTDREWDFTPIQTYSETRPYANSKKLAEVLHKKTLKELREGDNQEAWGMGPLTVNAYYSPSVNKFVMPIGILQYPFFVAEGDVIENLGAVGTVVAHELGHAIDDQGAKFDSKGRLQQWMTDDDVKNFKERGEKLITQFNKIGHNGELTLGENTADLVGVTFAYKAAFPNGQGKVEDKKKFFIAYGRLWCDVTREKTKEMQLKTDPHSLGFARINEQVKHQPGFYEAFSCNSRNKLFLSEKDRVNIWN